MVTRIFRSRPLLSLTLVGVCLTAIAIFGYEIRAYLLDRRILDALHKREGVEIVQTGDPPWIYSVLNSLSDRDVTPIESVIITNVHGGFEATTLNLPRHPYGLAFSGCELSQVCGELDCKIPRVQLLASKIQPQALARLLRDAHVEYLDLYESPLPDFEDGAENQLLGIETCGVILDEVRLERLLKVSKRLETLTIMGGRVDDSIIDAIELYAAPSVKFVILRKVQIDIGQYVRLENARRWKVLVDPKTENELQ